MTAFKTLAIRPAAVLLVMLVALAVTSSTVGSAAEARVHRVMRT